MHCYFFTKVCAREVTVIKLPVASNFTTLTTKNAWVILGRTLMLEGWGHGKILEDNYWCVKTWYEMVSSEEKDKLEGSIRLCTPSLVGKTELSKHARIHHSREDIWERREGWRERGGDQISSVQCDQGEIAAGWSHFLQVGFLIGWLARGGGKELSSIEK